MARIPSAEFIATATLTGHILRFHKNGKDGSAKCDIYFTGSDQDRVFGVVFEIDSGQKSILDYQEGLGSGYEEKNVSLISQPAGTIQAYTYYATKIDPVLKPFHWYKQHVLMGAEEFGLPEEYIEEIRSIESLADPRQDRHISELAIYM